MLELIDYIREYVASLEPSAVFRESRFAYDDTSGQWLPTNEDSAPILCLSQWVSANTSGSNTTTTLVLQWLYTINVTDSNARQFQQNALARLQAITNYIGGENTDLPLYQIASANYTLVDTDTPFVCAGATLNLTITAKDFYFTCCDLPEPEEPENPVCEAECPPFNLDFSIQAANAIPNTVAPDTVPLPGEDMLVGFDIPGGGANAGNLPPITNLYYVDESGTSFARTPSPYSTARDNFYFTYTETENQLPGTIWVQFEGCPYIQIPVPSTP